MVIIDASRNLAPAFARRLAGLLCVLLLALGDGARVQAADISVDADHNPVAQGESFVLSFEGNSIDGDPDLSPLNQDFDVLGTSKRSSITIIDGHFSKTTTWQINLMPKRSGTITIPPIHFGKDVSKPLELTVSAAPIAGSKAPDLFVEAEATPDNPYVQAQVLLRVRVFTAHDLEVTNWSMSDPKAAGGDAIVVTLGKDRLYEQSHNGHRYDVLERDYAVFPQKHGKLHFDPVVFEGQAVEGSASLFDPFSNDIRSRRVESNPITLDVRPPPAAFTGRHWLPATALQLHETWSDDLDKVQAGEPITRTLSLLVNGQTASQLPDLPASVPSALKTYPDQPVLDDQKKNEGVIGLRQEKLAIIASQGGDFTVPAIAIPWWNTATDQMEIATLPAHTLHVIAAAGANAPAPAVTAPVPNNAGTPPPAVTVSKSPPPVESAPAYWRWFSLALAAGWGLTLLALWRMRRGPGTARAGRTVATRPAASEAFKAIRKAAEKSDATATREALLAWGRSRWPEAPPLHLSEIAAREPALAASIEELQRCLYGRGGAAWSPQPLLAALQSVPAGPAGPGADARHGLQPLFMAHR